MGGPGSGKWSLDKRVCTEWCTELRVGDLVDTHTFNPSLGLGVQGEYKAGRTALRWETYLVGGDPRIFIRCIRFGGDGAAIQEEILQENNLVLQKQDHGSRWRFVCNGCGRPRNLLFLPQPWHRRSREFLCWECHRLTWLSIQRAPWKAEPLFWRRYRLLERMERPSLSDRQRTRMLIRLLERTREAVEHDEALRLRRALRHAKQSVGATDCRPDTTTWSADAGR
jgi:hypothetical protein